MQHDPPSHPEFSGSKSGNSRWLIWFGIGVGLALVVGVIWIEPWKKPQDLPLKGELKIWVRSGGIHTPTIPVGDVGSLPVRAGHSMQMNVQYNLKAHTYLLWINSEGQVIPLYPWNMDDIEVKDADTVPPKCLATDFLESPATIGKGWIFSKQPGMETVLLLGRRQPLEKKLKLGSLLGRMKSEKNRNPQESAILVWDREKKSIQYTLNQNRPIEETEKSDQELKEIMARLADDFEVVVAYRFAHEK